MTEERTFPNATQSIAMARRFTLGALSGIAPDVTDAVAVMVSELATNSVRHAATDFTISIERDDHRVRVAVTDAGDRLPNMKSPVPTEHSGRGLQIVSALADEWGVREMSGRPGKTVWFTVAVASHEPESDIDSSAREPGRRERMKSGGQPGGDPRPTRREPPARGRRDCRASRNRRHRAFAGSSRAG